MARYVVVEFSRNEDAEAFIKDVGEQCKAYRMDGILSKVPRRIVGVFVKPGKTCECWDASHINYGDKNREHGIALGEKFGWWVCTKCNRPRAAGHQLRNQLSMTEMYEGVVFNDFEFGVTNLDVSGFHVNQIDRPKKLRSKRKKK